MNISFAALDFAQRAWELSGTLSLGDPRWFVVRAFEEVLVGVEATVDGGWNVIVKNPSQDPRNAGFWEAVSRRAKEMWLATIVEHLDPEATDTLSALARRYGLTAMVLKGAGIDTKPVLTQPRTVGSGDSEGNPGPSHKVCGTLKIRRRSMRMPSRN